MMLAFLGQCGPTQLGIDNFQDMSNETITWRQRVSAACCYLGLFPLYALLSRARNDDHVRHHYRQAGALYAILAVLTLAFIASAITLSILLVHQRTIYQDFHLERYTLGILRKGYIAWLVFWAFGLGLALLGSNRPMPILNRLAKQTFPVRFAIGFTVAAYGLCALLVPVAYHASILAPADNVEGKVHFVYEDNGIFPRWLFLIAFYPMTRTAVGLWGHDSVVITRFQREAVYRAARDAEFIYLGTHGTPKGLMLEGGWLTPEDLDDIPINPNLRFVYLSGCDSGQQRDEWLAAFAPARVITYDRLSAVLEHAWWLWFRGPGTLREIHEELYA